MTQLKRRLAVLLSFIMVFTTVFVAAPTEAKAATTSYGMSTTNGAYSGYELVVFKGTENLYAGDFYIGYKYVSSSTSYSYENLGYLSTLSGVKYSSDNKNVATVASDGKITVKGTGKVTITVKWKDYTGTLNFVALSEKDFFNNLKDWDGSDYYKTLAKGVTSEAKAFLKEIGSAYKSKITTKNRYDFLSAYKAYDAYSGYQYVYKYDATNGTYTYSYYYYSPSAVRANNARSKLMNYISSTAQNPFATYSSKYFKVSSISGKGKSDTIKVTLKSKVTADMIFAANYQFSWDTKVKSSKTYSFPIVVRNTSDNHEYYAIATVKEGSKTMTIKLQNSKLSKGKKYVLEARTATGWHGSYLGDWLTDYTGKGKVKNSFKAK